MTMIRVPLAMFEALLAKAGEIPVPVESGPVSVVPDSTVARLLANHGPLSLSDIVKGTKLNRVAAWEEIKALREAGTVVREGSRRGSRYKLHSA